MIAFITFALFILQTQLFTFNEFMDTFDKNSLRDGKKLAICVDSLVKSCDDPVTVERLYRAVDLVYEDFASAQNQRFKYYIERDLLNGGEYHKYANKKRFREKFLDSLDMAGLELDGLYEVEVRMKESFLKRVFIGSASPVLNAYLSVKEDIWLEHGFSTSYFQVVDQLWTFEKFIMDDRFEMYRNEFIRYYSSAAMFVVRGSIHHNSYGTIDKDGKRVDEGKIYEANLDLVHRLASNNVYPLTQSIFSEFLEQLEKNDMMYLKNTFYWYSEHNINLKYRQLANN